MAFSKFLTYMVWTMDAIVGMVGGGHFGLGTSGLIWELKFLLVLGTIIVIISQKMDF